MFTHFHNMKNKLCSSKGGQVAVILIFVIAIALIFYAVSFNLGRIAQIKTLVTVASNTGASYLGSLMASYAQNLSEVWLNGGDEKCAKTGVFGAIVAAAVAVVILVVAIIAIPFTMGTSLAIGASTATAIITGLAISVAVAVANIGLQAAVVQPMISSMWNKMMAEMPAADQYMENGIQAGLSKAVTDGFRVVDWTDFDSDGLYGWDASESKPKDQVGRFALYYQKRRLGTMKTKNKTFVLNFIASLENFLYYDPSKYFGDTWGIYDPVKICLNNSLCDPCCLPPGEVDTFGNPLRSATCGDAATVEATCLANSPYNDASASYPWVYEPYYENEFNNPTIMSLREELGRDDKHQLYTKNSATPNKEQNVTSPLPILLPPINFLINDVTGFHDADKRSGIFKFFYEIADFQLDPVDSVVAPVDIVANDGDCAQMAFIDPPYAGAGFWKKGDDQYCSSTWPYFQGCPKHMESSSGSPCKSSVSVYDEITGTDIFPDIDCECNEVIDHVGWPDDVLDDLQYDFLQFIAWAEPLVKNPGFSLFADFKKWYPEAAEWVAPAGKLYKMNDTMRGVRNRVKAWKTASYPSSGELCSGTIGEIIACLEINIFIESTRVPFDMGTIVAYTSRRNYLRSLRTQANDIMRILDEAITEFNRFLGGTAVSEWITYRQNLEDNPKPSLPSQAIYAWRDAFNSSYENVSGRTVGYWHIVRVDARIPSRCNGRCDQLKWPTVGTHTSGFLGSKRCYTLENETGRIKLRVTRFDEDREPAVMKFPNGQPIWDFRFYHPDIGAATIADLTLKCDPLLLPDPGESATQLSYGKAFMMNEKVTIITHDDCIAACDLPEVLRKDACKKRCQPANEPCWDYVNQLLSHGVSATTCAKYLRASGRMEVNFTSCVGRF